MPNPPVTPPGEGSENFMDATNPVFLKTYFENFKNIMKRQMPNVSDKELYQDAFVQMLELVLTDEQKTDIEYLNKIIDAAKQIDPPIEVVIPTDARTRSETKQVEKEEQGIESQKQQQVEKEGKPLEEQLLEALAEERYEDAAKIQEQLDRLNKLLGTDAGFKGTLCLGDAE